MNPSSAAFFETMYRETPDPWDFAQDPIELQRYDAIMDALRPRRYQHAFEPGCSIGVLTAQLATLCDAVDACDISETAAASARRRCAHLPHVRVTCASLSDTASLAGYDLVVLSEIGYYQSAADWRKLSTRLIASMPTRATLLASHWLGHSVDHQISGDEVHGILLQNPRLHLEETQRHATFRLEKWVCV